MDIQTRKLNFIQEFLQIPNEDFIISLDEKLQEYRREVFAAELKADIEKSLQDSANDDVISAEDLREEIKSWS